MDSAEVSEIKRHIGVIAEGLQGQIRQVAEGVSAVDAKIDRVDAKIDREVAEVKRHSGVIADGLQSQIRLVAEGVALVDSKIDREVGGLRGEIRTEFAETKAMIRFSHAELDNRVGRLEKSVASLESRVERIETR